jgi:hypothetical protein
MLHKKNIQVKLDIVSPDASGIKPGSFAKKSQIKNVIFNA